MPLLADWPAWLSRTIWTLAIVGGAYLVGHLIKVVAGARLAKIARRSGGDWDDALLGEVQRRIPFWSLLVGVYLSLEHWPLNPRTQQLATEVLSALGVASATFAAAAIASRLVVTYGPRAVPSAPVSGLTQNLARIIVTIIGALVIVRSSFGYEIGPMLTALGIGGLAVALALQEPLSNLFAGIFMAIAGQVRIGDYIKLDSGAEGYVVDFNWRSTRLRPQGDNLVVVPNSKLSQAVVTNFSMPTGEMGIGVDLTIDRSADLAAAERIVDEVAADVMQSVPGAVSSAKPVVRYQGFTDLGIKMTVGVRVKEFADQVAVKSELVKRLHERLTKEGVRLR